jgi:hypothetical protein
MVDITVSGGAQFNIIMSRVYSRSPKRVSHRGSVTLAGSLTVSPEKS